MMDWTLLLLPGLIWGASFLFIAEGLEALAPNGVTFLRFVFGFLTLSLVPGARQPVRKSDRAGVAWLGVLWMAFPMSMFPFAEQHVSSALTGMLNGALPIIATFVAAVLARTMPARLVLVGLAVGFADTGLMAVPAFGSGVSSKAWAVLLILLALVSYGVALSIARPLQQRNGALAVVWRAQAVALLLTAPLGVPAVLNAHWNWRSVLAIVALGCLGTAVASVVMAVASGKLGATRASATSFLIPVVSLLLGVAVRHETVPSIAITGVALCLTGAGLMRWGARV